MLQKSVQVNRKILATPNGQAPQLSFKLLKSESNTVSRKIIEAMYINQLKPEINDKEECISISRVLVKN